MWGYESLSVGSWVLVGVRRTEYTWRGGERWVMSVGLWVIVRGRRVAWGQRARTEFGAIVLPLGVCGYRIKGGREWWQLRS